MALRICVLGSGSAGNCTCVASAGTRILVDAGLSGTETARRLEMIGVAPAEIHAICVTHEHSDHVAGLSGLYRRLKLPLYANAGTIESLVQNPKIQELPWNVFTTGHPFQVGDLRLEPFSVPHDSYDPVGFVVSESGSADPAGGGRIGIMTDAGIATDLIRVRLRSCGVVVLEANHDEQLLRDSERPWPLKQRIASRQGHLSNKQAAELLAEIAGPGLRVVFLAHLSSECNRPDLAVETVSRLLRETGINGVSIKMTYPDRPSDVVEC